MVLTLTEPSDVTVTVYDMLGRAVVVPVSGVLAAGVHRAEVEASRLAPGVYVVRAVVNAGAGSVVRTARLTIAR